MSPRRVVVLRHAERPDDVLDPHLSAQGARRAERLALWIPERFGAPDELFAAAISKHSDRPVETLTPLAQTLGLRIEDSFADEDYEALAANLLHDPRYGRKRIVICWHHGHIPDLALALGANADDLAAAPGMTGLYWNADIFDRFWVLDFAGGVVFRSVSQGPAGLDAEA